MICQTKQVDSLDNNVQNILLVRFRKLFEFGYSDLFASYAVIGQQILLPDGLHRTLVQPKIRNIGQTALPIGQGSIVIN